MTDPRLSRLAAVAAVLGGIGQIAGTASEPDVSDDPPTAMLTLAHNSAWEANRVLDVLTFLLVLFALAVFAGTVGERGRPWTRAGLVFLAMVGGLGNAGVLTQLSLGTVANGWFDAGADPRPSYEVVYRAVNEISSNLFAGAFLSFGAMAALFGAGVIAGRTQPRWIGWALYPAAVCLVGGTLGLTAADWAFLFVLVGLGVIDVLLIVIGVVLWPRRPAGAILGVTPGRPHDAKAVEGVEP